MRNALSLSLFLGLSAIAQTRRPSERAVKTFHAEGVSRLAALAHLGAITQTSILVQVGSMSFARDKVVIVAEHTTAANLVKEIMKGTEQYIVADRGNLLVVSPSHPSNRLLALRLGPVTFRGSSISELQPLLAYYVRMATGCSQMGYAWAGAPMEAGIPHFILPDPTFEEILERVANAQKPTMWILAVEPTQYGCIESPGSQWQVGLYGCQTAFRESVGPNFINYEQLPNAAADGCSNIDHPELMPNPVPLFK